LGRDYYERGAGKNKGNRKRHESKRLKTAQGEVMLEAPQLRSTEESCRSEFLRGIDNLSLQLKRLVVEMYARRLSTRDIEDALKDAEMGKLLVGKDGLSELTAELWEEYQRFSERDLSIYDVVYLFADGMFESLR
jgi:transposase-like protein